MRLRSLCLLSLCLLCSGPGCGFAFGSAYVGQWREREEVEYRACLEDERGGCAVEKEVTTTLPSRGYWGVALSFPSLGASFAAAEGRSDAAWRLEASAEVLGGSGRWALGLRAGSVFDLGTLAAWPVMAVGHVGLSERFSTYAGFGWSPYTRFFSEDLQLDGTSSSVLRAVGGLQVVLNRSEESRFLWIVEADRMWSAGELDYGSWGFTTQLGVSI